MDDDAKLLTRLYARAYELTGIQFYDLLAEWYWMTDNDIACVNSTKVDVCYSDFR